MSDRVRIHKGRVYNLSRVREASQMMKEVPGSHHPIWRQWGAVFLFSLTLYFYLLLSSPRKSDPALMKVTSIKANREKAKLKSRHVSYMQTNMI